MKFSSQCFLGLLASSMMMATGVVGQSCSATDPTCASTTPYEMDFVTPKLTLHGKVIESHKDAKDAVIMGCCVSDDAGLKPKEIGKIPQMNSDLTMQVLENAKKAWKGGSGTWPQMSLKERIKAITNLLDELKTQREVIVRTLMWEIGKNRKDAESEFDRTLQFCNQLLETISKHPEYHGHWESVGSTQAFIKRAAIGIIMCLGPMNYPLNETYATLIPALLMGNVAIMKVPTVGGLSHLLTMEAFAKTLPPGAMNFVSGRGRETMPTLMKTGDIDGLAFIGGSRAADELIKQHPHPHRLKVFLQLEAKNMGIFLPSIFDNKDEMSKALDQSILGALSFNGQRCTALKLFFAPKKQGKSFASMMAKRVEEMTVGLPWQDWSSDESKSPSYSKITPLHDRKKVEYMQKLVQDAVSKGAQIINKNGGEVIGGSQSSLMVPAVVYPVTPDMDLYYEEQFGPIIPIATYDSLDTILDYGHNGAFGQQVAIFASESSSDDTAMLVDQFSSVFGKININSQCGRSPDTIPFSGRRSSAMGVMSVQHALQEFSIPTVVAYKESPSTAKLVKKVESSSKFLESL
mmetsp:Transcript_34400/g.83505  ORF Transcript_34400/g.83505 Transcript_34400/m.83505 type:complete len:576 (+) Transcript_34400:100-1827(+)